MRTITTDRPLEHEFFTVAIRKPKSVALREARKNLRDARQMAELNGWDDDSAEIVRRREAQLAAVKAA